MVPTSWFAILGFFAFIAPGVLFDLLYARKQAERRETAFREVGRIALVSTWCTVWAIAIILALGAAVRGIFKSSRDYIVEPRDLILGDRTFIADHLGGFATAGVVFIAVSLLVSRLTFWKLHGKDPGRVTHVSNWRKLFRDDAPSGTYPLARVRMQNGTSWVGRIVHYSPDLEVADRELVLGPPLAVKAAAGPACDLSSDWGRVVLSGAQIESITVRYLRAGACDPAAGTNGAG
ncbi:DUF6338 family protein [Rhodococcus sp. 14-2470-1a]|uniref:DUF6338 family protein n=1 Tax=Rhodococcus sp. 14-2470-1a TaxID=2023150 RepID=UPI002696A29B